MVRRLMVYPNGPRRKVQMLPGSTEHKEIKHLKLDLVENLAITQDYQAKNHLR